MADSSLFSSLGFEVVCTVHEYYDGPRAGLAAFEGRPHAYLSLWDLEHDDWSDVFALTPVTDAQLAVAREDWAIWRRYQAAYHAGRVPTDSGPALPADHERGGALAPQVAALLETSAGATAYATAEFQRRPDGSQVREPCELEVKWTRTVRPPGLVDRPSLGGAT